MTTAFETEACSRCHGTGNFSFNGEHSRCYKCDGKNGCRAYTKRGAAAKAYYEAKLMVSVSEIKTGDKIRTLYIKQLTVAKIEEHAPTGRAWNNGVEIALKNVIEFHNVHGVVIQTFIGETIRRIPTTGENAALLADALAYQESLTKDGKPRKRG